MADQKVSDLPSLSGADVDAADLLYIIDSSAGSAGSKKITVGQYQLAPVSGGTANGVMYLNASKVATAGSDLVFDGSNLGIGTSSPGVKLDVNGGSIRTTSWVDITPSTATNNALYRSTNTGGTFYLGLDNSAGGVTGTGYAGAIWHTGAYPIGFGTSNALRLTLDSSGNLGLGVTPSAWLGAGYIDFPGNGYVGNAATYSSNTLSIGLNAYYGTGSWRYKASSLAASRFDQGNGTFEWYTAPSGTAGDAISFTRAMTLDASGNLALTQTRTYNASANIAFEIGGTDNGFVDNGRTSSWRQYVAGDAANGQALRFDGFVRGTGWTERARITSGGDLLVGTTSSTRYQNQRCLVATVPNNGDLAINHSTVNSSGDVYVGFGYNGAAIGSVTQSGTTAVLYNTTSDQRLKTNIVDAPDASALIDSIKVRSFDWIADGSHQRYGMVAQELAKIAPEAVHQPVDPDEMMAVDYSKLVPMLIKEIQSLRARVAALESA